MRKLRPLATFLGALALIVAIPATAHANVLTLLPQNADGLEQTFSPAYDYDGDGCYATAAIGADGTINPGLKLGGDVNGKCHDYAQLANANTYSRAKCDNGWCAVMYASSSRRTRRPWVRRPSGTPTTGSTSWCGSSAVESTDTAQPTSSSASA